MPPTSDDLKVALDQQVQDFALCGLIELDKECSLVETRVAVSPAFPGFWPGRWSNEAVAGNVTVIDVGGDHSGHSSGNHGAREERKDAFYARENLHFHYCKAREILKGCSDSKVSSDVVRA